MSEPLSLASLPELLARVPVLERELAELRAETESLRDRLEGLGRPAEVKCPECECELFNTRKSAPSPRGIRRRRECRGCGHRFTTYEVIGR